MKKIIYSILGVLSAFMFIVMLYFFLTVKSVYQEMADQYNQNFPHSEKLKTTADYQKHINENMQEYGFAALCYLGLAVLGYKLTKRENNKRLNKQV